MTSVVSFTFHIATLFWSRLLCIRMPHPSFTSSIFLQYCPSYSVHHSSLCIWHGFILPLLQHITIVTTSIYPAGPIPPALTLFQSSLSRPYPSLSFSRLSAVPHPNNHILIPSPKWHIHLSSSVSRCHTLFIHPLLYFDGVRYIVIHFASEILPGPTLSSLLISSLSHPSIMVSHKLR